MSTATAVPGAGTGRGPVTELFLGGGRARRVTWLLVALLVLFSVVRVISGQQALTSSSTFGAALLLAVPLLLVALGGLFAERAGVVNIGLEGMMILGTWGAGWAGYQWGWVGALVGGAICGALGGLLHAVATVTFGVDHVVSGVAINILAAGVVRFLSELLYTDNPAGGGVTQSPSLSSRPPSFSLPVLSSGPDLLGDLESRHWFLVSDLAGLLRGVSSGVGVLTVLAVLMVPAAYLVLWRTAFGLRLRSCGENPAAADSLGVPVYRLKYIAVIISGMLAGLGGVFLVFIANIYREGQTNGRGFIGLAALIFGNWRPGGLAAGAGLFGFADALQLRSQTAVVALLLLVTFLLAGVAVWQLFRGKRMQAVIAAAFAAATLAAFLTIEELPDGIVSFTPHLTTLLVLSLASQRLRPPKADGLVYRRGEH
ncbi:MULTISPECIES: ABC transporter permease [unclassified Modestobacter]|uniref:ABC transporter permease n=1 Tax=unclassified Modestobacter TaxID=2643866 RepID=UPI0022AB1DA4|nr:MULTISPECIES: ABC transporter permease [unclassified Modestobacter]MCZ2823716.1 ABC transporter permease [Modestobacter sp. VKM Ac-2981]MCZ2851961.1 ABC transporter permease [Modestobacter sp. VKM Ac-2982]